ncbi:glycosyltransferase family 1 protein [bacterium]|nr:glycosyltransferase family 1 protein [bacterium]
MNILGILPHSIGGRLTISSVFDGFTQNGHAVEVFDELKQSDFLNFIAGKNYDYIVGYDFSGLKLKIDNNLQIFSINYFSDVIESKASGVGEEWNKYLPYLNEEGNYTFYWDKILSEKTQIKKLYYMPHFVNTEIYNAKNIEKEYDIMFAGRLDTDYRLNFFIELMQYFPKLNFAWFAIEKHYKDALSRTDEKELIEKSYKGFIDNEEDMALELNKAKIVFNMNSQGASSLNYRTIQTIACKTLMISDFREEINLFKGDLPFYINIADLTDKIKYYLNNEKAYEYTTNKCFEVVSKHLNSKNCVNRMLELLTR